jgi:hypothetical protein
VKHGNSGNFVVEPTEECAATHWRVTNITASGTASVSLVGEQLNGREAAGPCSNGSFVWTWSAVTPRRLAFDLSVSGSGFSAVALLVELFDGESVWGMGEQFSFLNLRGQSIPVLTREQGALQCKRCHAVTDDRWLGVGRGLFPVTEIMNLVGDGAGGNPRTTYTAVPQFLTSAGRSLMFSNTDFGYADALRAFKRLTRAQNF